MAKRKGKVYSPDPPEKGLSAAELTEVQTLEAHVAKEEAADVLVGGRRTTDESLEPERAPEPYKPPPVPPAPSAAEAAEEIKCLEARIKCDQDRIFALQHPYVPFPKMVKGHTFASQEALDAAGPEYSG